MGGEISKRRARGDKNAKCQKENKNARGRQRRRQAPKGSLYESDHGVREEDGDDKEQEDEACRNGAPPDYRNRRASFQQRCGLDGEREALTTLHATRFYPGCGGSETENTESAEAELHIRTPLLGSVVPPTERGRQSPNPFSHM